MPYPNDEMPSPGGEWGGANNNNPIYQIMMQILGGKRPFYQGVGDAGKMQGADPSGFSPVDFSMPVGDLVPPSGGSPVDAGVRDEIDMVESDQLLTDLGGLNRKPTLRKKLITPSYMKDPRHKGI